MRHLGSLESLQHAKSLVSYLLVQGIDCHLDQSGNEVEIWVKDEDRLAEAASEFDAFRRDPSDGKYEASVSAAAKIIRENERERKAIRKRIVNVSRGGLNRKPRLTLILIGLCILVAVLTNFGVRPRFDEARPVESVNKIVAHQTNPIYRMLQFTCVGPPDSNQIKQTYFQTNAENRDALVVRTASLLRGEIWRLITPIFIHYGPMHIVFNLYMLFQFGSLLERRYSWQRLGLLVLVTAAISNIVQCTVPYAWGGSPSVPVGGDPVYIMTMLGGMSGVVYGLFGYVWVKSVCDREFGFRIPESSVVIMIVWLFGCMFAETLAKGGISIFPANVANWAHAIGLLVGMVAGYLQSPERKR
jgi:GlpG protein